MNYVLKLHAKMNNKPFGKMIFSKMIARKAPYFSTIDPRIEELKHNFIKVSMKKKRSVENHLKTVHAIASCNLCEFAAGICMESSIPKHRRWIPTGMDVKYLHKATTDLVATCYLDFVDWETVEDVPCYVDVRDANNLKVVEATINMRVSDKKKK